MTIISPLANLDFNAKGPSLAEFVDQFVTALAASGLSGLTSLRSPVRGKSEAKSVDAWRKALAASPADSVLLRWGQLHTGTVSESGQTLKISLGCSVENDREKLPEMLAICARTVSSLAQSVEISDLRLSRDGQAGFKCLPMTPAVGQTSHAASVSDAQIDAGYSGREAFLAAWPDRRQIAGRWLLFRGLDVAPNVEFLRVLIDSQWTLARTARPKQTRYADPIVEDYEQAVYHAGGPTLHPAAHIAAGNIVEVTCTPPDGEFIRGWEVFDLRHMIVNGALADGRRVEQLRVIFLDRETAEANKRPLLDIGATVAFPDATGEPSYVND